MTIDSKPPYGSSPLQGTARSRLSNRSTSLRPIYRFWIFDLKEGDRVAAGRSKHGLRRDAEATLGGSAVRSLMKKRPAEARDYVRGGGGEACDWKSQPR